MTQEAQHIKKNCQHQSQFCQIKALIDTKKKITERNKGVKMNQSLKSNAFESGAIKFYMNIFRNHNYV